jgi:hypothetical protein
MTSETLFDHELKKVRSFIAEVKRPFLSKSLGGSYHYDFLRFPKVKPTKLKKEEKPKDLSKVQVISVEEQEKKGEAKGWNLAALHAHHCCVSQKHPAFVHLEQLLLKGSGLNQQRVSSWKFKEYLIAAKKLESFVKDQMQKPPSEAKKRNISQILDPSKNHDKEKDPWQDYVQTPRESLFQLTGLKNP